VEIQQALSGEHSSAGLSQNREMSACGKHPRVSVSSARIQRLPDAFNRSSTLQDHKLLGMKNCESAKTL
jgi:hypothetical protein